MNIAYLINYAGSGGSEKYVKIISEKARAAGNNIIFIYNQYGPLAKHMEGLGIPVFNVKMCSPFDLIAAKRISAICKANKIDIIHVQFPRENYIALLSRLFYNSEVVYTCHLLYPKNTMWCFFNKIFTKLNKRVIAVCTPVKKLLMENGISEDKIAVIYNGIIPYTSAGPACDIRLEHSISKEDFLCVLLGRYTEEKGIAFLVDSFALLKGKAKCIIVGEGPLFPDITAQIEELGLKDTIIQAGYRSNVFDYLLASDISLNSSNSEAFSFAILEGMSASLPTVATDVGGNSEMLNGFECCGTVVPYGSCRDFANAVLNLKNDTELYNLYSKNAHSNLINHFHLNIMVEKTLNIYKEN